MRTLSWVLAVNKKKEVKSPVPLSLPGSLQVSKYCLRMYQKLWYIPWTRRRKSQLLWLDHRTRFLKPLKSLLPRNRRNQRTASLWTLAISKRKKPHTSERKRRRNSRLKKHRSSSLRLSRTPSPKLPKKKYKRSKRYPPKPYLKKILGPVSLRFLKKTKASLNLVCKDKNSRTSSPWFMSLNGTWKKS